ncbi:MAG: sigma-54 dependent transcriptional regulator [bacterium]|nr:sigma-54 dependent transcriptional regulator [bacterium]
MAGERILVVDDEERMRHLLERLLGGEGYEVRTASNGADALRLLSEADSDLVISDVRMPGMDGLTLLRTLKEQGSSAVVIMMTAFGTVSSAVEAMNAGAYHYLTKPFKIDEMTLLVRKALESLNLQREVKTLRAEVEERYGLGKLIGKSKAMQDVFKMIRRIAQTHSTVLITGSTGTGKELGAKALHYQSNRRDRPFVAVNCSAIPETLMESELFGHMKGSFTGAVGSQKGLFEEAHNGTLFLDEVGEVPLPIQVKLLRSIQEREIRRIGGRENIQIDVRIISATNRDLEELVREGSFREDLYYRLNVIPIRIPGLRERPDDIPLLAQHFIGKFCEENGIELKRLSKNALQALLAYDWPGNVRELENVIERAIALCENEEIDNTDFPTHIVENHSGLISTRAGMDISLEELERLHIESILEKTGGHQIRAAKILGVDRRTLYRKLVKYGLKKGTQQEYNS